MNKIETKSIAISEIKPNPKNPKKHWVEKIEESMREFGYVEPIVVDEDDMILAGHGRLKSLKELGETEVDVVVRRGLTEKQKERYMLLSNKIVERGGWDNVLLKEFEEVDLLDVGFTDIDIDKIFLSEFDAKDDEIPEVKEAICKKGNLWQLGKHRLLCGDSTKKEDMEKLMNGEKADMIFTDPPYGISYGKKNRFLNSFQKAGRNLKDIVNDDLPRNKLFVMLTKAFTNAYNFGEDWCSYYVTAPQGGELGLMMMMMMKSNLPVRHVLIWVKNSQNFSLGRLDYEYKHEPILYTWKKNHRFFGKSDCSVWEIDKPKASKLHPTMKPVELCSRAIKNSSKRNDIILDLFGGSGSTLIACENLNRKCYIMEIDSNYCDVIIKRWEKYSGEKAQLIKNKADKTDRNEQNAQSQS